MAMTRPRSDRVDPARVLEHFRRARGLLGIQSKIPIKDEYILSLVYTPGVAEPCMAIHRDPEASFIYTIRGNAIAVLTDGQPDRAERVQMVFSDPYQPGGGPA